MARMIRPLANVHEQLRRLPGIGSKTALRLAYHIIDMPEEEVRRLAETLLEAKRQIRLCDICYNLTDAETCEVLRQCRTRPQCSLRCGTAAGCNGDGTQPRL